MSRTGTTTRDRVRDEAPAPAASTRPRRWRRRRGRRHPLLVAALVPLVLATAAWVLWESPAFAVRTVQVDGVSLLTVNDVRAVVGARPGTPLLRVDVDAAAARVRRLPQVAGAQVSRGWPDRIVVTVTERVPVATAEHAGRRYLVDATGVLFAPVDGPAPAGVVSLAVPDPGPRDPATRAALAAVVALPPALRGEVASVSATTGRDVTLALDSPPAPATTVLWGSGDGSAAKASALAALLDQMRGGALGRAATVDVSTPGAVVLR